MGRVKIGVSLTRASHLIVEVIVVREVFLCFRVPLVDIYVRKFVGWDKTR
jgi:hypothetical protein